MRLVSILPLMCSGLVLGFGCSDQASTQDAGAPEAAVSDGIVTDDASSDSQPPADAVAGDSMPVADASGPDHSTPDAMYPSLYFPPTTAGDDTWETVSPAQLGWDEAKLGQAVAYAEAHNSTAFLILHRGRLVVERYWQGWTLHDSALIASAAKSMTAALVVMLAQDGQLSVDDPVTAHLGAGWSSAPAGKEALITVRHLLTMTSGLNDSLGYVADAGTVWAYNTPAYNALSEVIAQASGLSRLDFSEAELESVIGMHGARWRPKSMIASGRDMARFGLLMLARGAWAGTPLIADDALFEAMLAPSQGLNPAYGYLWWLNGQPSYLLPDGSTGTGSLIPAAPDDLVAALGLGDKKIYVVPSLELVVCRHGDATGTPQLSLSSFDNQLWGLLMQAIP